MLINIVGSSYVYCSQPTTKSKQESYLFSLLPKRHVRIVTFAQKNSVPVFNCLFFSPCIYSLYIPGLYSCLVYSIIWHCLRRLVVPLLFLKKNGYQNKNASVEIIRCLIKFTLPEDVSRDLLFIICRPEHSHDQPWDPIIPDLSSCAARYRPLCKIIARGIGWGPIIIMYTSASGLLMQTYQTHLTGSLQRLMIMFLYTLYAHWYDTECVLGTGVA
jgi:hypothetical protein